MTDAVTKESARPIRLGILGAGWFASRRHLPDAQANPEVVLAGLCRRDPEARARLAERFGVSSDCLYGDWEQMFDEANLDAVLISTPNSLHYPQAKAALERGLHVLIEKPMTVRSAEARELLALAREKRLRVAVALNPPYWAHCHRMRRALRNEEMGPLESVSFYWTGSAEYLFGRVPPPDNMPGVVPPTLYRADPELNGGGYFIDGGSHLVSELLWVTGLRAKRVSALFDCTPTDMRAAVNIEMENGAVATINSIGDSKFPNRRVRNIFGSANGVVTVVGYEFETTIRLEGQEAQKFKEADLLPVKQPVSNFIDALQGRSEIYSSGEHGLHVVEVVEAACESARTGQTITLAA